MRKIILTCAGLGLGAFSIYASESTKAYVWGNGFYQAIPGQGLSFQNFSPKLLTDFTDSKLKKMFLCEYFEAGISSKGDGYIWDAHKLSSSSQKDFDDGKRNNIIKINTSNVEQIKFTKQYVWVLDKQGDVYQYPVQDGKFINTSKKVNSLKNVKQIETGVDHFVALTQEGDLYTMGDDTLGQCGQGQNKRSTAPPYYENRIRVPSKINNLPPIEKVTCGSNHTIALSKEGSVFGWGSNSQMQLSHLQEFSKVAEPLLAIYNPVRISSMMDSNNIVTNIAAGGEFSIFVTRNKLNNETELFGCGHNLRGQIGASFVRHVTDLVKIDGLSNYRIQVADGQYKNVEIEEISCGLNHCMVLTSANVVLEWGDNEYGQLGNQRRSFSDKPIVVKQFMQDKILSVSCGHNSSSVIIQK